MRDGREMVRLAIAMLTLRVHTPPGEWLSPGDEELFHQLYADALATDDEISHEYLVLNMMNLAWYALQYLEVTDTRLPPKTAGEWLATIVADLEVDEPPAS